MEKQAIFHLKRDVYRGDTTLGFLLDHNQDHFCYVLEDIVRPYGIKDKTKTAIPETKGDDLYLLRVLPSGRYGEAVTVFNEMEGGVPVLNYGGIKFTYIRCHGGNDDEDTEGCLLVNKNRDISTMKAWGSMMKELTDKIKSFTDQGFDCRLRVTNLPQKA